MSGKNTAATGPSGLVVVDKPAGMTSHDVVGRMRRIAGTRRVGHAGTLDPMATGVLILGVNQGTKLLTWVVGESKTYRAVIRLGQSTLTDDAEGDVTETAPAGAVSALTEDRIRAGIAELTGEIQQVPSAVSAIKVDGVRSYARVRSGEEVALAARPVTVSRFELESTSPAEADGAEVLDLTVEVSCSSGTYVRALARDLGAALGTGGHLTALRRTRIGEVGLADAATLDALQAAREAEEPLPLLPVEDAARRLFRARELSAAEATDLSHGRFVAPSAPADPSVVAKATKNDVVPAEDLTACFAPDGTLVALARNERRKGREVAVPHLVLASGQTFGDVEETA